VLSLLRDHFCPKGMRKTRRRLDKSLQHCNAFDISNFESFASNNNIYAQKYTHFLGVLINANGDVQSVLVSCFSGPETVDYPLSTHKDLLQ
jgi:hypothetical protein